MFEDIMMFSLIEPYWALWVTVKESRLSRYATGTMCSKFETSLAPEGSVQDIGV